MELLNSAIVEKFLIGKRTATFSYNSVEKQSYFQLSSDKKIYLTNHKLLKLQSLVNEYGIDDLYSLIQEAKEFEC